MLGKTAHKNRNIHLCAGKPDKLIETRTFSMRNTILQSKSEWILYP